MNTAHQLIRLFRLAVWDQHGREYLPVMGYYKSSEISHYAPAVEALDAFWERQMQFTLEGVF